GRSVTADHQLLLGDAFQLDPRAAAPARFVNGFGLLADDAFEPALAHLGEKLFRITADFRGIANRIGGLAEQLAQNRTTLAQWFLPQISAVVMEQIENI